MAQKPLHQMTRDELASIAIRNLEEARLCIIPGGESRDRFMWTEFEEVLGQLGLAKLPSSTGQQCAANARHSLLQYSRQWPDGKQGQKLAQALEAAKELVGRGVPAADSAA